MAKGSFKTPQAVRASIVDLNQVVAEMTDADGVVQEYTQLEFDALDENERQQIIDAGGYDPDRGYVKDDISEIHERVSTLDNREDRIHAVEKYIDDLEAKAGDNLRHVVFVDEDGFPVDMSHSDYDNMIIPLDLTEDGSYMAPAPIAIISHRRKSEEDDISTGGIEGSEFSLLTNGVKQIRVRSFAESDPGEYIVDASALSEKEVRQFVDDINGYFSDEQENAISAMVAEASVYKDVVRDEKGNVIERNEYQIEDWTDLPFHTMTKANAMCAQVGLMHRKAWAAAFEERNGRKPVYKTRVYTDENGKTRHARGDRPSKRMTIAMQNRQVLTRTKLIDTVCKQHNVPFGFKKA